MSLLAQYVTLGIRQLVVVRGDIPPGMTGPGGDFGHANELVAFIRAETGDHFHIEVAAHPEFHPEASDATADLESFKRKVEAGASSALTQYLYNADAYLVTFHFLRQQEEKLPGRPYECLADFVAPKDTGCRDYLGAFALTTGLGIDRHIARFEQAHDDYGALMLRAIADRLAEAFAERMHERVRREFWGYAGDERLDHEALLREQYRGIRPAVGYPACPDHTEKTVLWDLLGVPERIGMSLTETFAMVPAASVSGAVLRPPAITLLRGGTHQSRPGRRLCPTQGDGRRPDGAMAGVEPRIRASPRGRNLDQEAGMKARSHRQVDTNSAIAPAPTGRTDSVARSAARATARAGWA